MDVLILGANGFIGHHLCASILNTTSWRVYAMDMQFDRLADLMPHERLTCYEGDITINHEWLEYHIKKCDVVLPLVAIATPATYVKDPLAVFELDFEANLPWARETAPGSGAHRRRPQASPRRGRRTRRTGRRGRRDPPGKSLPRRRAR